MDGSRINLKKADYLLLGIIAAALLLSIFQVRSLWLVGICLVGLLLVVILQAANVKGRFRFWISLVSVAAAFLFLAVMLIRTSFFPFMMKATLEDKFMKAGHYWVEVSNDNTGNVQIQVDEESWNLEVPEGAEIDVYYQKGSIFKHLGYGGRISCPARQ